MEAKDLMIGDWMYNCIADIRFQVYPQFFSQWYNRSEQFGTIIQPVPLTPEILEKNGFAKCEPHGYNLYAKKRDGSGLYGIFWQDEEYNCYLEVNNYAGNYGEFNKTSIKYVHQLQQVLRLCGIDKTIEL